MIGLLAHRIPILITPYLLLLFLSFINKLYDRPLSNRLLIVFQSASPIVLEEGTKIGRDVVLYVESLIEFFMGGLEGLINMLDLEGEFGALENQLLPEQVASYLNYAPRVSIPSYKSTKAAAGFPLPGHVSYPENNSSIKMLEAAMQRLTNLCSVLNDMEPICVLNQVFVLREYMRECVEEATWEDAEHVHLEFLSC